MSVDIEALKRLRETIYIARWWNGWPEAIALLDRTITALERAERVEAAARAVADDHNQEPFAADLFAQYPEELAGMKRRYELLGALRAELAPAPGEEGK